MEKAVMAMGSTGGGAGVAVGFPVAAGVATGVAAGFAVGAGLAVGDGLGAGVPEKGGQALRIKARGTAKKTSVAMEPGFLNIKTLLLHRLPASKNRDRFRASRRCIL
jgi:hypothetical protein